jgi:hypothetical protein
MPFPSSSASKVQKKQCVTHPIKNQYTREIENISRGPTTEDFVTIRTEGSVQGITVARLQSTRVQTPLSPLF